MTFNGVGGPFSREIAKVGWGGGGGGGVGGWIMMTIIDSVFYKNRHCHLVIHNHDIQWCGRVFQSGLSNLVENSDVDFF